MLTIRLFGPLTIAVDGVPLPKMRSQIGRQVLAYLVIRRAQPMERSRIASLFWPDSDEERALFYLRRTLSELRQALGAESERLQTPTPRTLAFDINASDCDLTAFETAIKSGELERAISLYAGPLLEGSDDEWILGHREYYASQYLQALTDRAEAVEAIGDLQAAIGYLRLIVRADRTREAAQRDLMRLSSLLGDKAAALQVYRDLRLYLMRENLGAPSAETEAVYQAVRQDTYRNSLAAPKGIAFVSAGKPAPTSPPVEERITHHLPVPLTPIIGRNQEASEVAGLLQTARLVTITGNGGAGKTRLAIRIGQLIADTFPGGSHFIDLSLLSNREVDESQILQLISRVLEIGVTADLSLVSVVVEEIGTRRTLLIFDNCEHLMESSAQVIVTLLASCPNLRVLATSRQSLGIIGERVMRLPPLSDTAAMTLFLERAMANAPQRIAETDVGRLCRLLEGMPLAIELAAAWTAFLPIAHIETNLQDRLFSPSGNRSLPARHQTLRATLDWGYQLLSTEEQSLFARLSLFTGGWTWEAAQKVIGGSPLLLAGLVDKSLVVFNGERYSYLETVRQFAQEMWTDTTDKDQANRALASWCLNIITEGAPYLHRKENLHYLRCFDDEYQNIRTALDSCITMDPDTGLRLAISLTPYWQLRGLHGEGLSYFSHLLPLASERDTSLLMNALQQASTLATTVGNTAQAEKWLEAAIPLAQQTGDTALEARILQSYSNIAHHRGDYQQALELLEKALLLLRAMQDRLGEAQCLENLGYLARKFGNYEQSARLLQETMLLYQRLENVHGEVSVIGSLAYTRFLQGKLPLAVSLFEKALEIHRATGNKGGIGWNLSCLGEVMMAIGDYARADSLLKEALSIHQQIGSRGGEAWNREHLARLAARTADPTTAYRQYLEASLIQAEIGNNAAADRLKQEAEAIPLPDGV